MASTRSRSRRKIDNNPGSSSSNQVIKDEIVQNEKFSVRCRCCLEDGDLKDMWATYFSDGERETYGEMISDCFSLAWKQPNRPEKICEMCISRVKDAFSFKKEILEAEQVLLQHRDEEIEEQSAKVIKEETELLEELVSEDSNTGRLDNMEFDVKMDDSSQEDDNGAEYLDIEYLEDDAGVVKASVETETVAPKRKWPKKKKKEERTMEYKQYTEKELRKSIQAVKSNMMTRSEAAEFFNVPVKTLGHKLRAEYKEENKDSSSGIRIPVTTEALRTKTALRENAQPTTKHIENIKTILKYSNATPIRGHWGKGYVCCFCNDQFPKPDDLKTHTLHTHDDKKHFMEGKSAYEFIVKLDITDLHCVLCQEEISTLEKLMEHLKVLHYRNIHTDIKHQILPFKFGDVLRCVMCPKQFRCFKLLSQHMDEHYRNFECDLCDRGFVNKSSLKMHKYRHENEEWICQYCSKVFNSRVKVRSHQRTVHLLNSKACRCGYCGEMFGDTTAKSKHEHMVHGIEQKVYECHACDCTYSRQISLTKHVMDKHLMFRPYKCNVCDKSFVDKKRLNSHMVVHTGLKEFQCHVCSKTFSRKQTMCSHFRSHVE